MSEEEESERNVPAVQQAIKKLSQYINATDREVTRLTASEERLTESNRLLTEGLRDAERRAFENYEEVKRLTAKEKEHLRAMADLRIRADHGDNDLRRRAEEAEAKATAWGQQNEELAKKAELGTKLGTAAQRMIEAIERLPTKMADAGMIRSTGQEIPLYDTYEWQAVSDARFLLSGALGEGEEATDDR
jgi:hypothetical protein